MRSVLRVLIEKEWRAIARWWQPQRASFVPGAIRRLRLVTVPVMLFLVGGVTAGMGAFPTLGVVLSIAIGVLVGTDGALAGVHFPGQHVPYELLVTQPVDRRKVFLSKLIVASAVLAALLMPASLGYLANWAGLLPEPFLFCVQLRSQPQPCTLVVCAALAAFALAVGLHRGVLIAGSDPRTMVRLARREILPVVLLLTGMIVSLETEMNGPVSDGMAVVTLAALIATPLYLRAAARALDEREIPEGS